MKDLEFSFILEKLSQFSFPDVDFVLGIGRGGIVPAALVAYQLNKECGVISLNFRDENNQPCREGPVVVKPFVPPKGVQRILLVDDVSVSGKTLDTAKGLLKGYQVKTFVLIGQGDYVLLPEIKECVFWPWKKLL